MTDFRFQKGRACTWQLVAGRDLDSFVGVVRHVLVERQPRYVQLVQAMTDSGQAKNASSEIEELVDEGEGDQQQDHNRV